MTREAREDKSDWADVVGRATNNGKKRPAGRRDVDAGTPGSLGGLLFLFGGRGGWDFVFPLGGFGGVGSFVGFGDGLGDGGGDGAGDDEVAGDLDDDGGQRYGRSKDATTDCCDRYPDVPYQTKELRCRFF